MDKFENQFEDLDVQTAYIENSMSQTTALSTPQDQIDELMQKVADENGLEMQIGMPIGNGILESGKDQESVDLTARLAKLRNP